MNYISTPNIIKKIETGKKPQLIKTILFSIAIDIRVIAIGLFKFFVFFMLMNG